MSVLKAIERCPMWAFVLITALVAVASAWSLQGHLFNFAYFMGAMPSGLLAGTTMMIRHRARSGTADQKLCCDPPPGEPSR